MGNRPRAIRKQGHRHEIAAVPVRSVPHERGGFLSIGEKNVSGDSGVIPARAGIARSGACDKRVNTLAEI